ncbi:MAG: hypothetical protein MR051_06275 [Lentisphaeria bacterium]|nr:hypothetical protein [Lentisphaeria bacterium]
MRRLHGGLSLSSKGEIASAVGHRQRVIEKFRKTGGNGFFDYEYLELLLFFAIPRRDVKPTAKALLAKFGSLRGVLAAETEELIQVPGIGKTTVVLLHLLQRIFVSGLYEEVREHPVSEHPQITDSYLRWNYGNLRTEHLVFLLLDERNRLIDELQYAGDGSSVHCDRQELLRSILLRRNVESVMILHNHPNGDICPSHQDLNATRLIQNMLQTVGIRLKDSLIVTAEHTISLSKFVDRK